MCATKSLEKNKMSKTPIIRVFIGKHLIIKGEIRRVFANKTHIRGFFILYFFQRILRHINITHRVFFAYYSFSKYAKLG